MRFEGFWWAAGVEEMAAVGGCLSTMAAVRGMKKDGGTLMETLECFFPLHSAEGEEGSWWLGASSRTPSGLVRVWKKRCPKDGGGVRFNQLT